MHPAKPAKSSRSTVARPPPSSASAAESRAPARWSDLLVAAKRSDHTIAQLRRELKKKQVAWAALTGHPAPPPPAANAKTAPGAPGAQAAPDSVTTLRAALAWYESQEAYVAMVPYLIKHLSLRERERPRVSLRGGENDILVDVALAPTWQVYRDCVHNSNSLVNGISLFFKKIKEYPPKSSATESQIRTKTAIFNAMLYKMKVLTTFLNINNKIVNSMFNRIPADQITVPLDIVTKLCDIYTAFNLIRTDPVACRSDKFVARLDAINTLIESNLKQLGAQIAIADETTSTTVGGGFGFRCLNKNATEQKIEKTIANAKILIAQKNKKIAAKQETLDVDSAQIKLEVYAANKAMNPNSREIDMSPEALEKELAELTKDDATTNAGVNEFNSDELAELAELERMFDESGEFGSQGGNRRPRRNTVKPKSKK
jgi:hypothetical protein